MRTDWKTPLLAAGRFQHGAGSRARSLKVGK
jgi:hypothetical protein